MLNGANLHLAHLKKPRYVQQYINQWLQQSYVSKLMFKTYQIPLFGLLLLTIAVAACSPRGPSPYTDEARSYLQDVRLAALDIRDQELTVAGIPSITLWDCNDPARFIDVTADTEDIDQYYVALGLLDPNDDLGTLTQNNIPETYAAFDVNSLDVLWMPEACEGGEISEFTTLEEAVYLRAFIVGMQSRNLNLRGLFTAGRVNADYTLAVRALSSGDAAYVTEQYLQNLDGVDDAEIEEASIFNYANELVTDESADFYRELTAFEHIAGLAFVEALLEEGSWETVNEAYTTRPRSTEHILHPDRFLADDEPLDVEVISVNELFGVEGQMNLSDMSGNLGGSASSGGGLAGGGGLGGGDDTDAVEVEEDPTEAGDEDAEATPEAEEEIVGWQLIREDVVGELKLRMQLAVHLDEETVDTAATGWGGDEIEVYYNSATNERAWLMRLAMDTPTDLEELLTAYSAYLTLRTGAEGVDAADGSTCFAGDSETICINSNSAEFYPADEENIPSEVVIAAAPTTQLAVDMIDIQRDIEGS